MPGVLSAGAAAVTTGIGSGMGTVQACADVVRDGKESVNGEQDTRCRRQELA